MIGQGDGGGEERCREWDALPARKSPLRRYLEAADEIILSHYDSDMLQVVVMTVHSMTAKRAALETVQLTYSDHVKYAKKKKKKCDVVNAWLWNF